MKDDLVIKSVRDSRHSISQAVNHDPRRLVEYYKKLQLRHQERLIQNKINSKN